MVRFFFASNLKRSAPPTSYMVVRPLTSSEAILKPQTRNGEPRTFLSRQFGKIRKLAEHGIAANMFAAYFHDHVFVQSDLADRAIGILSEYEQQ